MHLFRHRTAALLLALAAGLTACDRDVTDPTLREDVDALLARAGLAPAPGDFTLTALLHDAIRTVQRERGTEAARLELERVRAAAASPDSTAYRQLGIVLDALGGELLDRAESAVQGRLLRLEAALDSAGGDLPESAVRQHAEALAALAASGAARAAGDSVGVLLQVTRAAELAAGVRRALLERDRLEGLPELFARAKAQLEGEAGGAARLRPHAELMVAATEAVERGRRKEAHRALQAVRDEEARLVVEVLGPTAATALVDQVDAALARLDPAAERARVQRMHAAAHDLAVRARRELERGRPEAAIDLASHAAGLANALRLTLSLR